MNCLQACHRGAISFRGHLAPAQWESYDPSRREALGAIGALAVGAGLIAVAPKALSDSAGPIRPPGASGSRLPRSLHPLRRVHEGLPDSRPAAESVAWRPGRLDDAVARAAHRLLRLLLQRLRLRLPDRRASDRCPLDAKQRVVLGTAHIDESRCRPWSQDVDCIVCQEMCPLTDKAIILDRAGTDRDRRVAPRGLASSPSAASAAAPASTTVPSRAKPQSESGRRLTAIPPEDTDLPCGRVAAERRLRTSCRDSLTWRRAVACPPLEGARPAGTLEWPPPANVGVTSLAAGRIMLRRTPSTLRDGSAACADRALDAVRDSRTAFPHSPRPTSTPRSRAP